MKHNFLLVFLLLSLGCARVQTLNLNPHLYSETPMQVLWIQLAGFSEEHIPLLKFNIADAAFKTNIEQVDCVGKMWSFNLFKLRPNASNSFMSQMAGTKNINGSCTDYDRTPLWLKLEDVGYKVSILESGAFGNQTLENAMSCSNNKFIDLNRVRLFLMGPEINSSKKTFHYQDPQEQVETYKEPGLYYDRSCQKGTCYSSLSNNFKSLWQQWIKSFDQNFVILRDFNFQKALLKKDLSMARETLQEIDRLVGEIRKNKNVLIVISGAESLPIEFPLQGKEWVEFERSGRNVLYKNSTLTSPVLAQGPMSENFCGIFEEVEMYNRLIYRPEGKKFSWDNLKPF